MSTSFFACAQPTHKANKLPNFQKGEDQIFAEISEFIQLGIGNLSDSLFFEATENFDSAWIGLSTVASIDSLSPHAQSVLWELRDTVQALLIHAAARSAARRIEMPIQAFMDDQIEEVEDSTTHSLDSILARLNPKDYSLPIEMPLPERVVKAIAVFTGPGRGYFSRWLNRRSRYQALVEEQLAARGMPKDLFYLAMVESGLNPKAWSRAKASGMWQFISETGRRYGLKDDWWQDDRRDLVKATGAALSYLNDLHTEFNDWPQAMASYNCGENRIRRIRARDSSLSYWEMELPKETMYYVPKILAAMIIGHNPKKFGFNITEPEAALEFDTVSIEYCTPIETISKLIKADEDLIKELNPSLRRWCTPPNKSPFMLYLPRGTRETFITEFAKLDKKDLVNWTRHGVARGENLGLIAGKYGVSVQALKEANSLKGSQISIGQSLMIPLSGNSKFNNPANVNITKGDLSDMQLPAQKKSQPNSPTTYRVRKGDNLYDISKRFSVSINQLLDYNNLSKKSVIVPGMTLLLNKQSDNSDKPAALEKLGRSSRKDNSDAERNSARNNKAREWETYKIQAGESLFSIASALKTEMDSLKEWNSIEGSQIAAGANLRYPSEFNPKRSEVHETKTNNLYRPGISIKNSHEVRPGETIYAIAKLYNVSTTDLLHWNLKENASVIHPGEVILVASPGNTDQIANSKADTESAASPLYYTIRSGDTLWDIASRYQTTVEKVKSLNPDLSNELRPGMKIRIQ